MDEQIGEVTAQNAVEMLLGLWKRALASVHFDPIPSPTKEADLVPVSQDGLSRRLICVTLSEDALTDAGRAYMEQYHGRVGELITLAAHYDNLAPAKVMDHQLKVRSRMIVQAIQWAQANGYVALPPESIGFTDQVRDRYREREAGQEVELGIGLHGVPRVPPA